MLPCHITILRQLYGEQVAHSNAFRNQAKSLSTFSSMPAERWSGKRQIYISSRQREVSTCLVFSPACSALSSTAANQHRPILQLGTATTGTVWFPQDAAKQLLQPTPSIPDPHAGTISSSPHLLLLSTNTHPPGQTELSPSLSPNKQDPIADTDLCYHVGDITSVGWEQDRVGIFGKLGEGAHILLSHRERGCCTAMLGRDRSGSSGKMPSHVPPRAQPSLSYTAAHYSSKTPQCCTSCQQTSGRDGGSMQEGGSHVPPPLKFHLSQC